MVKREPVLFNNSMWNAAASLDSRFQHYMPYHHKETAMKFLSNLHEKIDLIERFECEPLQTLSESTHEFDGFLNTIYDASSNINIFNQNIDQKTRIKTPMNNH